MGKLISPEYWNKTMLETTISRNELLECLTFLIDLLQFDFVFIKPCDNLDNILDAVVRYFEDEEIILIDMVFKKKTKYIFSLFLFMSL